MRITLGTTSFDTEHIVLAGGLTARRSASGQVVIDTTSAGAGDGATAIDSLEVPSNLTVGGALQVDGSATFNADVLAGSLESASSITAATSVQCGVGGFVASALAAATAPISGIPPGSLVCTNLDADYLDGQHGAYYRDASNLNAGTVPDARFPATLPVASGANLTNLVATNLASGTVPDARLSGAVVLTTGSQTISGIKTFTAGILSTRTNATDVALRGSTSGGTCLEILNGGAYTLRSAGGATDLRMYRSGAKTMTVDDGAGGAATLAVVGNASTTTGLSVGTTLSLPGIATGTTVGAAGGASALPATPTGYITVSIGGANQKIPYYAT